MKQLLLVLTVLVSACAPQVTRINLAGTDGSISIPLKDLRPAHEKESEIFSLMITSSAYGLYRKGDETLEPPLSQLLRRRAFDKLGADATKDVAIHHLVVYMNLQSELRRGAVGAGLGGVIGSLIATSGMTGANLAQSLVDRKAFESVAEEYQNALYTEAENPHKASVFVIYIDAEIAGRRVFTRTLAPTRAPEGQNAHELAVNSAIDYYLQQYELAGVPAAAVPAAVPAGSPGPAATPASAPET